MSQSAAFVAFPFWRDHWASLEGVPALLATADAALRRRTAGNHSTFPIGVSSDKETVGLAVSAMRGWAEGTPPKDASRRPELARRIYKLVQPMLSVAAWPRWLHLEQAFLDGAATGDLLFAAISLRTMCEELQRLHALDLNADQLALLAASDAPADRKRLQLFFAVAWTSLGVLPQQMKMDGKGWPSLKVMASAMPRLEEARQSLNSYVHPNYGSHIIALFPERAAAATLLLQAMIEVYEAFFALSWAKCPSVSDIERAFIREPEPWPQTVEHFLSQTLPELSGSAAHAIVAEVLEARQLTEWLTTTRPDLEAMLGCSDFAPLVNVLPRRLFLSGEQKEGLGYALWDGARAKDVIDLACARRADHILCSEFPSGAPKMSDQVRWVRFNKLSLDLAMLLDRVKAGAFKVQLVRQMARGNGLGALLCVRSLIEHRALAVWLPEALHNSLDEIAGQLKAATPLPDGATSIEKHLAKFLSVQAEGSRESKRAWTEQENGGVRTARLNLTKIVEAAFPADDKFRTFYALTSAALHGRTERGVELALDGAQRARHASILGALVLERLMEEEMDHTAQAVQISAQLDHAARFGGTDSADSDTMARQVFGSLGQPLTPNTDYSGSGTVSDPFCLGSHLQFHQASYALLGQLGVEAHDCQRQMDRDSAGRLCDRWRTPERDYWFLLRLAT